MEIEVVMESDKCPWCGSAVYSTPIGCIVYDCDSCVRWILPGVQSSKCRKIVEDREAVAQAIGAES